MTDDSTATEVEVQADDPDDFDSVYSELRGVTGIAVTAVLAPSVAGEQGVALDVLMVSLSSGAVTAFLQIIRTLAEARGPKFVLSIRRGRNQVKITADTFDEVEPAMRKLFGGQ
jgi:hypothetical protein